jgi:hypothetical protein
MHPIAGALLAFLAGVMIVYIVVVATGHALLQGSSDPGGRWAIRVMFQIGPLCALAAGIVAAIVVRRRLAHAESAMAATAAPATQSQSTNVRIAIIVLAAVVLAYLLARVLFGLP